MKIQNVHERLLPVPHEELGQLLGRLGSPSDVLWPSRPWPKMKFDRPLAKGAKGGHGRVYYSVAEYVPGVSVRFDFDPGRGLSRGIMGHHRFEVFPAGHDGARIRHTVEAKCWGKNWIRWFFLIRPLHNAVLEDALDCAEMALTGKVRKPARWSLYVRLLRWASERQRQASAPRGLRQLR